MMDYVKLKSEITTDPAALGYAGKTDQQIADLLNSLATGRTIARSVIPAHEIIEATVPGEWALLLATEKQRYQTIVAAGQVNLKGPNTRAMLGAMFGAGTQTRANLIALQSVAVSRAQESDLGRVEPGHVAKARGA